MLALTNDLEYGHKTVIEKIAKQLDLKEEEKDFLVEVGNTLPYLHFCHCLRVFAWVWEMCKQAGLSEKETIKHSRVALLHDVGKMEVPSRLLMKPKITDEEFEKIKPHAACSEKILNDSPFNDAAKGAGAHHEAWDGSGYPNKKKGSEIPLSARLTTIADGFDAQVRPHYSGQEPKTPNQAFASIKDLEGSRYEPDSVDLFEKTMTLIIPRELLDKHI